MFDATSRYAGLAIAELTVTDAEGGARVIAYVRRRFVPRAQTSTNLVSHAVQQGERLDHLAARYLGDPRQFWLVCDGNGALRPEELVEEPGRRVDIPLPGGL